MFNSLPNDRRCHFCGKGPFKSYAGLHRHISNTSTCQKKSQHEFGVYAGGIWEDGPTLQPDIEPLRDSDSSTEQDLSQEVFDIEVENFDISFEDDGIYGLGDDTSTASVNPLPLSTRPIFTSEIGNEKESLGRYVEDFNPESLAGAAWGQGMPAFESLRLKQEQAGSRWDPFEDEEEWELAEWLVDNVGQKQTDMFLKMRIVSYFSNLKGISITNTSDKGPN
jgi:hypothetical protein